MNQPQNPNDRSYGASVTLTDDAGRSLSCYIEQSFDLDGQEYVLLMPVDTPVDILVLDTDNEDEVSLATEEDIEKAFPTATRYSPRTTAFGMTCNREIRY